MSKEQYAEKLKDPRWQKKRLEVFQRDNWTCQKCGETDKTLHAHHRTYRGKEGKKLTSPWEIASHLVVTLCKDCHEKEHLESIASSDLINDLMSGVFWTDERLLLCKFIVDANARGWEASSILAYMIHAISCEHCGREAEAYHGESSVLGCLVGGENVSNH